VNGVQLPLISPTFALWHVDPLQQSASTVQMPLLGMQAEDEHLKVPALSGTHGLPSQHIPVYAHVSPGFLHTPGLQRGTPTASSWHPPLIAPMAPQHDADADEMLHA